MKLARRLALLAVLCALGFWLYSVFFPSPEKVVLKRIASLAATATVSPTTGPIARASKVSDIIGYFAPDAVINYDVIGQGAGSVSGRDEIRELAAGALATATSLNVQFQDATVRIGPDRQTAEVSCTAEVSAGENKDSGIQALRFDLRKSDGDWLITRVDTVRPLR